MLHLKLFLYIRFSVATHKSGHGKLEDK